VPGSIARVKRPPPSSTALADEALVGGAPQIARASTSPAPVGSKLPYRRPRLVRLGSVRDLTLGASAGFAEGAGTFRMPM
jgi:hypothetical protein